MFSSLITNFELPEYGKERKPFFIGIGLLTLFIGLIINIYTSHTTLTAAYIPFMVMVGFLSRYIGTIIIVSGITTWSVYYFSSSEIWGEIDLFTFRWLSFFLIGIVIRLLVRSIQTERMNLVQLSSTLAESLDARDKYTSFHSRNVAYYSQEIAKHIGLSKKQCKHIYLGGLLHDIGKIGVPESILNKPTGLTHAEFEVIKKHPETGYKMLSNNSNFQKNSILDMVLYHHERFDGKGYPRGLAGDSIPLVARIMAVADTFDAMTSRRVYRSNLDLEYTLKEIANNKGTQFDPSVVNTFMRLIEEGNIKISTQTSSKKSSI